MKKAQQEARGVQPGYLPESQVGKLARGIGLRRRITQSVAVNLQFLGLSRKEARNMTPKTLEEMASSRMEVTEELLGS